MSRNKNRSQKPLSQPKQSEQDYNLSESFKRVSPYVRQSRPKKNSRGTTNDQSQIHRHRDIVSNTSKGFSESTGTNTPTWDNIYRLEDKISSITKINNQEHSNLRIELESKIERKFDTLYQFFDKIENKVDTKLSKKWFFISVSVLASFVGIIWALSYNDVQKLPQRVTAIEKQLENSNNKTQIDEAIIDTTMNDTHFGDTKKYY